MDVSIVIVTKNRAKELAVTLEILKGYINGKQHEILVFIDGCLETELIKKTFPWVKWYGSKQSLGASPARYHLYKHAKGTIFIGFDDDAHPLSKNFIDDVINLFKSTNQLGVVAFEEIKGIFNSDEDALKASNNLEEQYFTNDFIGCGFAISKEAYLATNGFPTWMTIYGEETCVALEVLNHDYKILFTNRIKVNHRVDLEARKKMGKNYFRFQHQLLNTINFYLVYYKNPLKFIGKVIIHNGKKYGFKNINYFKNFSLALFKVVIKLPKTLKHRTPLPNTKIVAFKQLKALKY